MEIVLIKDEELPILKAASNIDTTKIDSLQTAEIQQKIVDRSIHNLSNEQLISLAESYPREMRDSADLVNQTWMRPSDIQGVLDWQVRVKEKYALVLQEISSRRKLAIEKMPIEEPPIEEP